MSNNGGTYTWSKVAASNASADNTVNWTEGQAPSSVNDSARAMMTSVAKWRDDISGAIVTSGTSSAYIISSNQIFDTATDFHGQVIAFTPHVTNAAGPVTMTVDGFANLPLRSSPGKELLASVLIQGTPYAATYNNTDGALYLHGGVSNVYDVPAGGTLIWWDDVLPSNGLWAWANGQVIASANTVCPILLARWGSRYGGNGVSTMGVPDLRESVPVGRNGMGSGADRGLFGGLFAAASTTLNAVFGVVTNTLGIGNLPSITSSAANNISVTVAAATPVVGNTGTLSNAGVGSGALNGVNSNSAAWQSYASLSGTTSNNISVTSSGTTNAPVNNMQPSTTCNFIIRLA